MRVFYNTIATVSTNTNYVLNMQNNHLILNQGQRIILINGIDLAQESQDTTNVASYTGAVL
jgi:hypothetical protein